MNPDAMDYPVAEVLERGRRLAEERRRAGLAVAPLVRTLDEVAARLQGLPPNAARAARRDLFLQARGVVRRLVLADPRLQFDRLL